MSNILFMPGCTFEMYEKATSMKLYKQLTTIYDNVVYYQLCCGAIGNEFNFTDNMARVDELLKQKISNHDIDSIIVVCANCYNYYKNECNDEIISSKVKHIYEIIDDNFIIDKDFKQAKINVHDPCRSRNCTEIQDSVRSILKKMNFEIIETKYTKALTKCCGNGAMVGYTSQRMKRKFLQDRQSEFNYPIVTYCSQCQKTLKNTTHVLNILMGDSE